MYLGVVRGVWVHSVKALELLGVWVACLGYLEKNEGLGKAWRLEHDGIKD